MVNIRTLPPKVNAGIIATVAFVGACVLATTPSYAQIGCFPRDETVKVLTDKHGESPRISALTGSGTLVEFWANADTGSWTLFITRPDGVVCLQAAGEGFELHKPPAKGRDG